MRHFVVCCALLAQHAVVCYSQSLDQVIAPQDRSHDFGSVARSANTDHEFILHNPYSSDLHIRQVRASCGCTTPILERDTIPPGESAKLTARFNTGSFTGQKTATLTLAIDRPLYTELQVTVKGYIRSDIVVHPGEANFGQVNAGESKDLELVVNYAGKSDWRIEDIKTPFPYITAEAVEVSRAAGSVQYKIKLALTEDAPAGTIETELMLLTNDRRLTTFPIQVTAAIESSLQFSPESIQLGVVSRGQASSQRIVLKSKSDFNIIGITADQTIVQFDAPESAKKVHLVLLNLLPSPNSLEPVVNDRLIITTDLKSDPIIIPLTYEIGASTAKSTPQTQASVQ